MPTIIPSGGWLIVKNPQYVEEATYGSIPTASPTLLWIGSVDNVEPIADIGYQEIRKVGSEDPYAALKGKELDTLKLSFGVQSSTFLKYAITAQGGGAGTIDASLSVLYSVKLSGTENYIIAQGCRPKSLKLSCSPGELLKALSLIHI